jgi:RNAse (barnase) inhibitor barstar
MNNEIYTVGNDCRHAYWLEADDVAFTGDLSGTLSIEDAHLFANAVNALHNILDVIPENAKLPLTIKIKELAEKGLKRK